MIRILICDDEGIVQESLKFIIQQRFKGECELAFAKNGRTAMELADVFRPDVVLMDIQMPGINGIEAMRGIRAKYENIVFIVLTAYDKIEYTQSSIDIGVLAYLTKPIKRKELTETLQKAMRIVERQKEKASYDLEIQEKLESVVPMIENGFVYSMLLEEGINEDTFFRYKELLEIEEKYGYAMVIECGDDFNKGKLSNAVGSGIKLQKHFMLFQEIVKERVSGMMGALMSNRVIVLIPCRQDNEAFRNVEHIDAVMCGNDGLAGYAIKALSEQQLAGSVVVVGQDADVEACQRVVEGTQTMTVYKPIAQLAKTAAEKAVEYARDGELKGVSDVKLTENGIEVPFLGLAPIAVTAENMDEVIIESGFHREDEVYLNVESRQ